MNLSFFLIFRLRLFYFVSLTILSSFVLTFSYYFYQVQLDVVIEH